MNDTFVYLIVTVILLVLVFLVSRYKYLYTTIYYEDGTKKTFGPFESEEFFCDWLTDHESKYEVSSYKLEYKNNNTIVNVP